MLQLLPVPSVLNHSYSKSEIASIEKMENIVYSGTPLRSEGWKTIQLGNSVNEESMSTDKLCQPMISDNCKTQPAE